MKRIQNTFLALLFSTALTAQQNDISKEKHHWGTITQDTTWGYAGVVKVGNMLYLSGETGQGSFSEQVKNVYSSIENNLKKFGATFQNVIKENLYTTNMDSMKYFDYIRKPFYKGDYPAATWVQISRLFVPECALEVEVIAQLPEKPIMPEWPGDMMLGTWGMQTKNGWLYETWEKAGENELRGKSFKVTGNDTMVLERVQLKKTKDGVYYIPTTARQNSEKPVVFTQTKAMGNLFVFENPAHDFPKRIGYEFVNENTLRAWIDSGPDTPQKRSNFNYQKKE